MENINNILKNFTNLKEYTEFMNNLVEADGSEISRGKDPHDNSKKQKEEEQEEVPAEGGEEMAPEGGEEPVVDPVAAPGSQVAIGNKNLDGEEADPEAIEVNISGKQDKINMKPKKEVNVNNTQ